MCSKCSKYLENDINDKYKLKLWTASKARSDWLLNLQITFVIHLSATRERFASEQIIIVAGINELNPLFVFYYLTVLVYTIHLDVSDWWWVFTAPLR